MLRDRGRIGLVAVQAEARPLLDLFEGAGRDRQGEAQLRVAELQGVRVILAEVMPGPVSAALGAQALIARHGARCLLSFGSAGALDPSLSPGTIVIAQQAIAHDAGMFLGGRFEPTGLMGRDEEGKLGFRRWFAADPELTTAALAAARARERPARAGTVVTGNQVIFSTARRRWLRATFDALAVEMETAGVAQVATAHKLPWVAVRAISDGASDELILDYGRLHRYLDDGLSAWQHQRKRWGYLLSHPQAWQRLRRLRRGLNLASAQAADVVRAMLAS